ncbi:PREDICTED: eukaryotic translation initiation factor 4G-like isoform X2 [Ipomoea nil]|uniref:eukaryotic translation initiation factor 4G-like isoform X2 n=1 Tax=Ipomoea nil TaxID=35883 RepID=UPI000900E5F6|nr:PREDICTED: eukaryotic translation initiation factor 4G-like isoform X2 [Ipomoea nil]
MSHNQSRSESRDSYQNRRPGRSGSFNQYRGSKGGGGGGGGGSGSAPAPSPSSSYNRSFNKKYNNAQGGYRVASDPSGSSARGVQNGAHQEQPLSEVLDAAPITTAGVPPLGTPVNVSNAPTQKINRAVPRPPPSNSSAGPDPNAPGTSKAPGDGSKSFPLQFGSLNPSFMNGMQVPARTSSAPPNLDEQKRSQARLNSLKPGPALPNPSTSVQPPAKKDVGKVDQFKKDSGKVDQFSNFEGPVHSRPKRDMPPSGPPPLTQTLKPSPHPLTGIHMQMPFHPAQPQVPVPYGGHGQIQSQAMSASSLPIQMTMPLLGNPSLQQPMFVTGLPPHPMSSQGIMHQGQGISFASGMNPQMPPQLGNMGMNIPPQFPQQQAGKFSSLRKTVKITHPETHEELRLDGSPGPRSHPSMPPQSQPLSSFPPTPINYYPNSYNNSSVYFQPPSSLPPKNSQNPQATRFYNQVTIKPAPGTPGEKDQVTVKPAPGIPGERDQLPLVSSPTSKDSQKHAKSHVVASVHPQKDSQASTQSSMLQPKQGYGSTHASSIPDHVVASVHPQKDSQASTQSSMLLQPKQGYGSTHASSIPDHVVASVHPQKDSQASTQSSMLLQPKQGYGSTHASSIPDHVVASVHPQKDSQASTQSSMLQPKQGYGSTHTSSIPEASMHSTVVLGSSLEAPSLTPVITTSDKGSIDVPVGSSEELFPDAIKAQQKKPGDVDPSSVQDEVARLSTSVLGLPPQPPETGDESAVGSTVDDIDTKPVDAHIEESSKPPDTESEENNTVPETTSENEKVKLHNVVQDSNNSKTQSESICSESSEFINQTEEHCLQRAASSSNEGSSEEITRGKVNESATCSSEVDNEADSSLSSSLDINDMNSKGTPLVIGVSTQDLHMGTKEIASPTTSIVDEESGSESHVCPEATSKHKDENDDTSLTTSIAKEKSLVYQDLPKSTLARGKKKKKEIYKKADAAGATSDLYVAYKGTEEKKENDTYVESIEGNIVDSSKPFTVEVVQDIVSVKEGDQVKVEPDDWEDAVDVSSPKLESPENGKQVVRGFNNYAEGCDEMTTKKYSRDFLFKFADLYTDLPEGFAIASDIAEVLMGSRSTVDATNEPYPSPGRIVDRPSGGSRPERRGSALGDEDKWSKLHVPLVTGRDMRPDMPYGSNSMGFRPNQGGNFGVLRNPHAPTSLQYAGGILAGPLHSVGSQGMQRNGVDADRWQRGTAFQKGLMPSPQSPLQVMHKAEKKYEVGSVTDEEQAKQRRLKAILNKLTPQNFEKLFQQVKDVKIDNVTTLNGVISQIFDKALMEPTFCEMYANFCFHLSAELPDLSIDSEKITFKRLLLNKCQEEFERGKREEQEANVTDGEGETKLSDEEREEKRLKARRRMLGNIRLIGELYKKKMLTERIMHECIKNLLGETENQNPDEENIEALCKLMSTIGEMIDHAKAKVHMDAYFAMMANLSINMKLSSRVRFMLKDAIDLRKNNWQQRRKVEGPKKIEEVHRDAAQERQAQASRVSRAPSMSSSVRRGQQIDFSLRGPSILPSPSSQMSGFRPMSPQMRDYGGQDSRLDDRNSFENRALSLPLTQRSHGDDITLGPQGGLARSFRGQTTAPITPSANIPSPGDPHRVASGMNGFSPMPDRITHGPREDSMQRYMPERVSSQYGHTGKQEWNMHYGNRDRGFDTALTSPPVRGGGTSSMQNVHQDKGLSEERLQDLSMSAIKEFYSARDEKEVALCMKDMNAPSFYPSMIALWITDSFERKDMERDLLGKLLVNLTKSREIVLSQDQLIQGFERVLTTLEDAVNDAPRAAEFLGRIFANMVLENTIPLNEIGRLLHEGGEEKGCLVETGLAADVLGSTLEMIKSEKGDSLLNDICKRSNLLLENFRPPGSNKQSKLDKFLFS